MDLKLISTSYNINYVKDIAHYCNNYISSKIFSTIIDVSSVTTSVMKLEKASAPTITYDATGMMVDFAPKYTDPFLNYSVTTSVMKLEKASAPTITYDATDMMVDFAPKYTDPFLIYVGLGDYISETI